MGEGPRYTEWPIASLIAEIERLQYNLGQVVIANAEVAKLNAEQAETIERLQQSIHACSTEEGLCYEKELARKDSEIERLTATLEWYADDTGNLDEYIEDKGKRAREALRGAAEPKPLPTESAKGATAAESTPGPLGYRG